MKTLKNIVILIFLIFTSCETEKSTIITIDTHDDINVINFTDSLNYTMNTDSQVNLPNMIAGGLDVAWFVVYTGQGGLDEEGYAAAEANAISKFDAIDRLVNKYAPNQIELALTSDDVRRIHAKGKKVAMIGVENAYPMGLDTSNVRKYWERGARYVSLAHNGHSQFSDSNTGEFDGTALHNGLSDIGKEVVSLLNYYGVMIDISHPSKEAIRQTILHSKTPIIASHSAARSLSDHPRNLDDQQLEWVKESGGVVQTVALARFINKEKHERYEAALNAHEGELDKKVSEKIKNDNSMNEYLKSNSINEFINNYKLSSNYKKDLTVILEELDDEFIKEHLNQDWNFIENRIKAQMANSIWGKSAMYQVNLKMDKVAMDALEQFPSARLLIK